MKMSNSVNKCCGAFAQRCKKCQKEIDELHDECVMKIKSGTLLPIDLSIMRISGVDRSRIMHIIKMNFMINPYSGLFNPTAYDIFAHIGCRGVYKIYDRYYEFISSSKGCDFSKCTMFLNNWKQLFLNFSKTCMGFEAIIAHEHLIGYATSQRDIKLLTEMVSNLFKNSPKEMLRKRSNGSLYLTDMACRYYIRKNSVAYI